MSIPICSWRQRRRRRSISGDAGRRRSAPPAQTRNQDRMEVSVAREKFVIQPHFRLQEWVAEEKGYFRDEGLDYEFRETMDSSSGKGHQLGNKVGAFQTIEQ